MTLVLLYSRGPGTKRFCSGDRVKRNRRLHWWKRVPLPQRTRPAQAIRSLSETHHRHGKRIRHRWGHVLHVVCDLTILFRECPFYQTGPKVSSFDRDSVPHLAATWARKLVKSGSFAAAVPPKKPKRWDGEQGGSFDQLEDEMRGLVQTIMQRSPMAIRMIKRALNAELDVTRINGICRDATLMYYLMEEAQEVKTPFWRNRPDFKKFPKFMTCYRFPQSIMPLQATYSNITCTSNNRQELPGECYWKETWFVKVWESRQPWNIRIGKCTLFPIKCRRPPEFEKILKECRRFWQPTSDIRYLRDWVLSIRLGYRHSGFK